MKNIAIKVIGIFFGQCWLLLWCIIIGWLVVASGSYSFREG